jgi:adenosine deaminase CECR1
MSHEFYQIMVGAPTMSLYSWKQLARWSIEYSCLSKEEQVKGQRYLNKSWKEFCEEVVNQYGDLMEGDQIDEAKAKMAYDKRG